MDVFESAPAAAALLGVTFATQGQTPTDALLLIDPISVVGL